MNIRYHQLYKNLTFGHKLKERCLYYRSMHYTHSRTLSDGHSSYPTISAKRSISCSRAVLFNDIDKRDICSALLF